LYCSYRVFSVHLPVAAAFAVYIWGILLCIFLVPNWWRLSRGHAYHYADFTFFQESYIGYGQILTLKNFLAFKAFSATIYEQGIHSYGHYTMTSSVVLSSTRTMKK